MSRSLSWIALFTTIAFFATTRGGSAQAPECKSLADPAARLACYDKAPVPSAASAAAARPAMRAAPVSGTATATYVDSIGAEDALMNARLKNICRGC